MIDWTQVDGLRADMGESFDEVVDVFLQEVDAGMRALDTPVPAQALAGKLHFLKGAALNLGFSAFAALCARAEEDAGAGHPETVDLDAIRLSYTESREAFLAGLSRRAA